MARRVDEGEGRGERSNPRQEPEERGAERNNVHDALIALTVAAGKSWIAVQRKSRIGGGRART